MMKKKSKKLLLWLFVLTFVLTGIAGCGTKQKDDQEAASTETAGAISSVDDIVGKKIGVQLGTTGDIYVSDYENDGSGTTVERYNKGADAVQALKQGKIDCVVIDEQRSHLWRRIRDLKFSMKNLRWKNMRSLSQRETMICWKRLIRH